MTSDRGSSIFEIWQMAIDGSGMRPLTRVGNAWFPKFLPDGSVVYTGGRTTWRISPAGGAPSRVTTALIYRASLSSDGTQFVCSYRDTATAPLQLALYQVGEETPRQRFAIPATADHQAQWGPDGRGVPWTAMPC